jgi:phospholipid-binding lipoprotein MlaA
MKYRVPSQAQPICIEAKFLKLGVALRACVLSILLLTIGVAQAQEETWDPIEPVNRGIFWFNEQADYYVLEPVAQGYDYVTPAVVQDSVRSFFENLRYPLLLVSDLVQLKFSQAGLHTGRFVINTTVGLGGLFDVASDMGLEKHNEDFGIALAYHGVPSGPYLVIPFLGPSNLRDGFGRVVGIFLNPIYYLNQTDLNSSDRFAISTGLTALDVVQTRTDLIEDLEAARKGTLDFYLAAQSAYNQRRRGLLYDGNPPDGDEMYEDEEFGDSLEEDAAEPAALELE